MRLTRRRTQEVRRLRLQDLIERFLGGSGYETPKVLASSHGIVFVMGIVNS